MSSRKIVFLNKLNEVEPIIKACEICHVAMVDADNKPYVLPFNFGYHNGVIYLHSDPQGKKIDILKKNSAVSINFTTDYELFHITENIACSYGMRYKSVVVNGNVEFIESDKEKIDTLNIFMKQYVKGKDFTYSAPAVKNVCVFIVKMDNFTGKTYGY